MLMMDLIRFRGIYHHKPMLEISFVFLGPSTNLYALLLHVLELDHLIIFQA